MKISGPRVLLCAYGLLVALGVVLTGLRSPEPGEPGAAEPAWLATRALPPNHRVREMDLERPTGRTEGLPEQERLLGKYVPAPGFAAGDSVRPNRLLAAPDLRPRAGSRHIVLPAAEPPGLAQALTPADTVAVCDLEACFLAALPVVAIVCAAGAESPCSIVLEVPAELPDSTWHRLLEGAAEDRLQLVLTP